MTQAPTTHRHDETILDHDRRACLGRPREDHMRVTSNDARTFTMSSDTSKALRAASLSSALALVLAACGGSTSTTSLFGGAGQGGSGGGNGGAGASTGAGTNGGGGSGATGGTLFGGGGNGLGGTGGTGGCAEACAPGTLCGPEGECIPGCDDQNPCGAPLSCCDGQCVDTTSDVDYCGSCVNDCVAPPNTDVSCVGSMCQTGGCTGNFVDCDGDPANGCESNMPCVCVPGEQQSCYSGDPLTQGIGACQDGTRTCGPTGTGWGPCLGQVQPENEICGNGIDEDCNGVIDDSPDADGDGWTKCGGDCCDDPSQGCTEPAKVNPGAYEFIGNNLDDDCDPGTSDSIAPAACSVASKFSGTNSTDLIQAMDLCQFTTANPPPAQKKWGVISSQLTSADKVVGPPDNLQVAVMTGYGTAVFPQLNGTMASLSSGTARDTNDPGYVAPNGGWMAGTTGQPPPVYLAANGGQLPDQCGQGSGSGANDSANLVTQIRVPTNAQSFSYKFKFYSAEYPEWVCDPYNDFYLCLLDSNAAGIPADTNISFDSLNNPVSVNNGFFDVCLGCPAGTAELAGTGTDGGTVWLTTTAPVVPGETISLEFMIFDVSDHAYDSLVLLDAFQWSINPSGVGTVED
jgi:hypothetical protein